MFPVYDEPKIAGIIRRNIPVGTDRNDVRSFLDTLAFRGVEIEGDTAYFPDRIFMRGWRYIKVTFEYKDGTMTGYEMQRIKI